MAGQPYLTNYFQLNFNPPKALFCTLSLSAERENMRSFQNNSTLFIELSCYAKRKGGSVFPLFFRRAESQPWRIEHIFCIITSVLQVCFTDLCSGQACCSCLSFHLLSASSLCLTLCTLTCDLLEFQAILFASYSSQGLHYNRDLIHSESCFFKENKICTRLVLASMAYID